MRHEKKPLISACLFDGRIQKSSPCLPYFNLLAQNNLIFGYVKGLNERIQEMQKNTMPFVSRKSYEALKGAFHRPETPNSNLRGSHGGVGERGAMASEGGLECTFRRFTR